MEPFVFNGESGRAVLLLHAYGSTSVDNRLLARELNRNDYTVKAINFTGHGTGTLEDVLEATPEQWTADAEQALIELQHDGYPKVAIFGLSLGGIVATRVMIDHPDVIVGGGNFSSPVLQTDVSDSYVPTGFSQMLAHNFKDRHFPADAIADKVDALRPKIFDSLTRLTDYSLGIQRDLPRLTQPYFVATAGNDHVVNPDNVAKIAERLHGQVPVSAHYYPNSGHAITVGKAHKELQHDVLDFLADLNWE